MDRSAAAFVNCSKSAMKRILQGLYVMINISKSVTKEYINVLKIVPFTTTSINLLQWAFDELVIPKAAKTMT